MKIQRYKRSRRIVNFFKNNFNFRVPYQVLVDGTFCSEALKFKLNIKDQMHKYLNGEVKLLTTPCVIMETELIGPPAYGAMLIVKQFKVRRCGHEKKPIGGAECLHSMIYEHGAPTVNPDHYFVATQDPDLGQKVSELPGVPLLYIKYNAILLEKPSALAVEVAESKNSEKYSTSDYHFQVAKDMKKKVFGESPVEKKRKRKIKGPNPLSCKKSKKKKIAEPVREANSNKRKRKRRVKLPKHIKDSETVSK